MAALRSLLFLDICVSIARISKRLLTIVVDMQVIHHVDVFDSATETISTSDTTKYVSILCILYTHIISNTHLQCPLHAQTLHATERQRDRDKFNRCLLFHLKIAKVKQRKNEIHNTPIGISTMFLIMFAILFQHMQRSMHNAHSMCQCFNVDFAPRFTHSVQCKYERIVLLAWERVVRRC